MKWVVGMRVKSVDNYGMRINGVVTDHAYDSVRVLWDGDKEDSGYDYSQPEYHDIKPDYSKKSREKGL